MAEDKEPNARTQFFRNILFQVCLGVENKLKPYSTVKQTRIGLGWLFHHFLVCSHGSDFTLPGPQWWWVVGVGVVSLIGLQALGDSREILQVLEKGIPWFPFWLSLLITVCALEKFLTSASLSFYIHGVWMLMLSYRFTMKNSNRAYTKDLTLCQ